MRRLLAAVTLGPIVCMPVSALSPPAHVIHVALGASPVAVTVNPTTGQVIALLPGGSLEVVDEATRRRSSLAVPTDSYAITVDVSSNRLYVTSGTYAVGGFLAGLTALDLSTRQASFVRALDIGLPVADPQNHQVYVTMPGYLYHTGLGWNSIAAFDGETLAQRFITTPGHSFAIAVDAAHSKIYVASIGGIDDAGSLQPVTVIDGESDATQPVSIGCDANLIAADAVAAQAWAGCGYVPRVALIRAGTVEEYQLQSEPRQLVVNPSTGRAYVALDGPMDLFEIDPTFRVVNAIPLAQPTGGLGVNPTTNAIYASHRGSGTVTVVDGISHETLEVVVGPEPSAIAVDPTRDIAWVTTSDGLTGLFGPDSACVRCTRVVVRPSR